MITLVSESRCAACGLCVRVCPVNVFDPHPDGVPRIARAADCQTCFLCEIYCPADALYVAPQADAAVTVDEADLAARGLLGGYARALGWKRGRMGGTAEDQTFRLRAATAGMEIPRPAPAEGTTRAA
ncbi:NAD-dependent dihydropyrimidine dehydrogenase PreA subunit [Azospirillum fermentarium]|uniref:4Fe-4S dicluster domain-containing protein n=1 Tax=Azospirillum fermentarium TaxID=1233114 RepID=UPI0022266252|nr:ferredoxin family protein [Azospirillum fermentarium]MCW2247921.1 NAD-dependent dihydropyrimidine dehydrogenase PreA subunit [Azospirillum fermentarium]